MSNNPRKYQYPNMSAERVNKISEEKIMEVQNSGNDQVKNLLQKTRLKNTY